MKNIKLKASKVLTGGLFVLLFIITTQVSISAAVPPGASYNDVFPDDQLALCVATNQGKKVDAIVTQSELDLIIQLDCGSENIDSIDGIENLTGLSTLYLYDNNITDLQPLTSLTSLKELALSNNNISDITPLANLIQLESLLLSNNNIDNISAVSNLTKLKTLYIDDNNISDIKPMENLIELERISLINNKITDISSLSKLVKLDSAYLGRNNINDISPLANLTALTKLAIDRNNISDLSPISNLTNLEVLYASNNKITDITPITNLNSIYYLDLRANNITDITALINIVNNNTTPVAITVDLNLDNNQIADISVLEPTNPNVKLKYSVKNQMINYQTEIQDNGIYQNKLYIPSGGVFNFTFTSGETYDSTTNQITTTSTNENFSFTHVDGTNEYSGSVNYNLVSAPTPNPTPGPTPNPQPGPIPGPTPNPQPVPTPIEINNNVEQQTTPMVMETGFKMPLVITLSLIVAMFGLLIINRNYTI